MIDTSNDNGIEEATAINVATQSTDFCNTNTLCVLDRLIIRDNYKTCWFSIFSDDTYQQQEENRHSNRFKLCPHFVILMLRHYFHNSVVPVSESMLTVMLSYIPYSPKKEEENEFNVIVLKIEKKSKLACILKDYFTTLNDEDDDFKKYDDFDDGFMEQVD